MVTNYMETDRSSSNMHTAADTDNSRDTPALPAWVLGVADSLRSTETTTTGATYGVGALRNERVAADQKANISCL